MKRIRIDARQQDLDMIEDILHHFVEHDVLDRKQSDCLEALKIAIVDAKERRIENQLNTIKYDHR
jgi:hypothetical protein